MADSRIKIQMFVNQDVPNIIKAKQGDALSRFLEVTLLGDDGIPFDLTSYTVRFNAKKPDGTHIFNNCTTIDAVGGVVEVELTDQTLAIGNATVFADFSIFSEDATQILTTRTMSIYVQAQIRDDAAIESSDEYSAVVALFQDVFDLRTIIIDMHSKFGKFDDDVGESQLPASTKSFFGAVNTIYNYVMANSSAGVVEKVNEIVNLIGIANPVDFNRDTIFNFMNLLQYKPNGINQSIFLEDGVFTVPDGVSEIYVTACGGGGAGYYSTAQTNGTSTIVGDLVTLLPGGKASSFQNGVAGGDGGSSGITGSTGNPQTQLKSHTCSINFGDIALSMGGCSLGIGAASISSSAINKMAICSIFPFATAAPAGSSNTLIIPSWGGGGYGLSNSKCGGGADSVYKRKYSVVSGDEINITVGKGGVGYSNAGNGICIIEW